MMTLLMIIINVQAQTIEKKWGFGAGAGGYYNLQSSSIGLSPEVYLSRYLSPSFDLMGDMLIGYFGNQNINEPLDNVNASLKLRYKLFNGKILPVQNRFQPYLSAGVGYLFDNSEAGPNFNLSAGMKYPLNKTLSLFAETGYIHGIETERTIPPANNLVTERDNFLKLVAGIEISFIRQKDGDKDGVIDLLDECPDTPKGALVDLKGCPFDSDGDGVFDGIDQCPNTMTGIKVDAEGCPLDSDGDGVADHMDDCPDTPAKVKVDDRGCPFDEDNDGVYDDDDRCKGTPAGVKVDKNGCPVDSDNDGVNDDVDQCPDTPKGVSVDELGCPADGDKDGVSDALDQCPETPEGAIVDDKGCINHSANIELINAKLAPVYFNTDQSEVSSAQHQKVDELVKILKQYPEYKVNLYGHADSRGSEDYNLQLSKKRVDRVVALIKARGIADEQIRTKAFGESEADEQLETEEQMRENRKVASYMFISFED